MSLEQREAELETRVPARAPSQRSKSGERRPRRCRWRNSAAPRLKRVTASTSLVSLQEIFAFMNKKNLRQYIYKVRFLLYFNSKMFMFTMLFIALV